MSDRKVWVAVSKDGGHTFGDFRERTLGELGQYLQTVRFRRFGLARDFRLKIRVTSPIRADLMTAYVDAEPAE